MRHVATKSAGKSPNGLAAGPLDLKTLAGGIRYEIDALLGEVAAMTAEGKIIEEKSGKLRINR